MELTDKRRKKLRTDFEVRRGMPPQINIDPSKMRAPVRSYSNRYTHDLEERVISLKEMMGDAGVVEFDIETVLNKDSLFKSSKTFKEKTNV